jgi:biotin operon repressor/chitodextrinase
MMVSVPETTASRLLRLLPLLSSRPFWRGDELAARLDVTTRTVRRDIDRLRELGYPVTATPGPHGGYALGPSRSGLPPLLLDDDSAVAVAIGLRLAAARGLADAATRAAAAIDQVLPARLRHQVEAFLKTTIPIPGSPVAHEDLSSLAQACHSGERLRFGYRDSAGNETRRHVEPYRLVATGNRWYLVAFDVEESALDATHAQLTTLYPEYGIHLKSQQIWQRLGATVMIGQNDIRDEDFTVSDASGLMSFVAANHLGRVSMWSLNRDSQCGSSFAEDGILSNTCSGTAESSMQFTSVFSSLGGDATATSGNGDVQPAVADTNAADAPYPIWNATADYPLGYKVVEDGEIYEAKWYNSGDDPAAQVQYAYQTPWELLGPVLPGDHAPQITTPSGDADLSAWSLNTLYQAGDKVLYQGLPYEARWSNQGTEPATAETDPGGSPWEALYTIPGEPTATVGATPSASASATAEP